MFTDVFSFELNYRFKRASTYIYILVFILLGFLITNVVGGAFTGARVMISSEKVLLNSPFILMLLIPIFGLMGIFIIASIMGFSIYRDFEYGTYPLFFTKPVNKAAYLFGRFFANVLVITVILLGLVIGMIIAQFMPWMERALFGDIKLINFLWPYVVNIIPNIIFMGAIFFSLAFVTRKMLPVYIGAIVIFVGYFASMSLFNSLDTKILAALLDPLGINAAAIVTENFSVAQQNTQLVPLTGYLLINRLIWLAVGMLMLFVTYLRFDFSHSQVKGKKIKLDDEKAEYRDIPQVKQAFGLKQEWNQLFSLTKIEFKEIIGSSGFITIAFAGLILVVLSVFQSGKIYETEVLPLTYNVLAVINGNFGLLSLIVLLVYTGESMWKSREYKLDGILESNPIKNWVVMFSKFNALLLVQLIMLIAASLVGIIYQTGKGFSDYNFQLYITNIGLKLVNIFLLEALIFFSHVMANNKFAGHGLAIILYLFVEYSGMLGLEHPLFHYGKGGGVVYSDMNGFGVMLEKWSAFRIYWAFFASLLLTVSLVFYPRGKETALKKRWQIAKNRLDIPTRYIAILFLVGFIGMGSYIYYNENVINDFKRAKTIELERVFYEKEYKHYQELPQPRYTDVYVQADIYPQENSAEIHGLMTAENKTSNPIDTLVIMLNTDLDYEYFEMNREYMTSFKDSDYGLYVYKLSEPLMPGESVVLDFNCTIARKGYNFSSSIVHNGTFFNSLAFYPHLGYNDGFELLSEEKRVKYDLPEKERMAAVDNQEARMNHYINDDADWVTYEAVLSTDIDQTAITPGYLQNEWTADGRKYFHYKMDHPVLNFFCYVSAVYEEKHSTWTDENGEEVALTVYYNEKHPYNVDRMLKALKQGLSYYTDNFGAYPDRQVRILEFPRYSAYAQSFANTIPYSESLGFVADVKDEKNDIDYPFFVTAHELGHQWWAHQVIGANVQGAVLMSEALAQYSALMVMEKEYGIEQVGDFLRHELSTYLMGRGNESIQEQPLYLVENQQYIHYNKGAITMYALRDYCGEDKVNQALSSYLKAVGWQEPPYTNSLEFMKYIEPIVPDSLSYITEDWFRKITLYDNKVNSASFEQQDKGKYKVTMEVEASKYYADGLGEEEKAEMNDYVEIVAFGNSYINGEKLQKVIYRKKHQLTEGTHEICFNTTRPPVKVGIDGLYKLTDKNIWDNLKDIKEATETSDESYSGVSLGAEVKDES